MTPQDLYTVLKVLLAFDWQLFLGLGLACLYFPIGIYLLLKEPARPQHDKDPTMVLYHKWRRPIIGLTFLVLGSWAASGASQIASGMGALATFGVFAYLFYRVYKLYKTWLKEMPVVGQTYTIKGIGDVVVQVVHYDNPTPLGNSVSFSDSLEVLHSVPVVQFQLQAKLLEDRSCTLPKKPKEERV